MNSGKEVLCSLAGALLIASSALAEDAPPRHQVPASKDGNLVVGLCDGETSVEVKGVKKGGSMSREQAQAVSNQLMAEWLKKNPDAHWDDARLVAQAGAAAIKPVASSSGGQGGVPAGTALPTQSGHTYGAFGKRDEAIWAASTQEFVAEGNRIFHDAKRLGGTIAVSCDMCHPNAANTHPETYPKYQVQLGRVAMLRDMINWCIENPVRGTPLRDDDPKLKAMEAYIYAQRKGVPLDYGKH